jgi:hypothetical protein
MIARLCPQIFVLLICFFLATDLSAQSFDSVLKKLHTEYPEEKLHLHFDKEVYYPGETIWFKAYLFAGNYPSDLSKVMYADLLDSNGNILHHTILPVMHSSSSGLFTLSSGINGRIVVRCYTKWMLNFDSTLLYEKDFYITKSPRDFSKSRQSTPVYRLEFFPEGGQLIEDVESRVAFKATDQFGIPVSVEGTISNNTDQSIVSFKTLHNGMGIITLRPLRNTTYRAKWKQDESTREAMLPSAQKTGLVLEIKNTGNAILYTIKRGTVPPISRFVYVIAQMNQHLVYRAKVNIEKNEITSGRLPTVGLPSGVIQFMVFTDDEKPIAERLVFANPEQASFSVNASAVNLDQGTRKKNTIEIEVPDSLSSNLSISVTADNPLSDPGNGNIYTSLLLNADVRGYIHNPGFYFSQADSASFYLDLVMMTHGWRKFKWKQVLAGSFAEIKYKPESSIIVDGEIKGLAQKEMQDKEIIGLIQLSSGKRHFLSSAIQPDGKFSFSNLAFYDSAKLYYQFANDKKEVLARKSRIKTVKHLLDRGISLPLQAPPSPPLTSINSKSSPGYQLYEKSQKWSDSLNAKLLKSVTVRARLTSKEDSLNAAYTSGAFAGQERSRIITPDDDPAFLSSPSLFDYLQNRVAGLQVNPNADENPVTWRGFPTALFVDEISQQVISQQSFTSVEDATQIRSLRMSDIAMVKIFNPPFLLASGNGPGGSIAVYLEKSRRGRSEVPRDFVQILGFSSPKAFYSPDYENDSSNREPDFRRTLYWNPYIMTNRQNRKVSCSFYTNDLPGTIKVVIEGCNEEGKFIRIEKVLN